MVQAECSSCLYKEGLGICKRVERLSDSYASHNLNKQRYSKRYECDIYIYIYIIRVRLMVIKQCRLNHLSFISFSYFLASSPIPLLTDNAFGEEGQLIHL